MNENSVENFMYSILFRFHNHIERVINPHSAEEEMRLKDRITWSRTFNCQGSLGS